MDDVAGEKSVGPQDEPRSFLGTMPDTARAKGIASSVVAGGRGRRLAIFAFAVGALVLSSLLSPLPASGAKASPTFFPPTAFGGYRWSAGWHGNVKQISAQWRVPKIQPSSKFEYASTWVGAQNPSGGPPFIQLGITENNFGQLGGEYRSFWSDTKVDFHPQVLSVVRPGDLVSADMTQVSDGWVLTFKDLTRHSTRTKNVPYGAGKTYSQAEWLQEDPAPKDDTPTDLPYPTTSVVQIGHLLVNHSAPKLRLENAQVLIASNGITLVPSAVERDAFHFSAPTGTAKTYLEIARSLDTSLSAFGAASSHWSNVPMARRLTIVNELEHSFQLNATALNALALPNHDAADLGQRSAVIVQDLSAWATAGLAERGAAFEKLTRDEQIERLADRVRADLGLPPS